MQKRIICAGVGGQGVLTLGMLLAESAAAQGKYVTWVPEYGSEMRGGSACCKVKIGDEEIISPFMEETDILVALHPKCLEQYVGKVEEGGVVLAENALADKTSQIKGRMVLNIPAVEFSEKKKNPKGMSVAMAGALIASTDLFSLEDALQEVTAYFEAKHLPAKMNTEIFLEGYHYVKDIL